jgi:MSHA biogenesis protein MshL
MATLRSPLLLALATLLVAGCSTIERAPMQVPSGDLDYKPAPPRPAKLDVKSRMPKFAMPSTMAETKLYNFRATGQPVRLALSQLASAYKLNIVVDQDVDGAVTVDLKDLPLEKVLEAMLEPIGLAWQWQDGLLHVSRLETRTFVIDYLRLVRSGTGSSSTATSLTGGGGGGGGGGGSTSTSSSTIAQNDTINFWEELEEQLQAILERSDEDRGDRERQMETTVQTDRATNITTTLTRPLKESAGRLIVDRTSGTIQVTTSRARMKNVVAFLKQVEKGIKRQVYIEAKVVEVALNDDQSLGIDWNAIDFGSLVLSTDVTIADPADGANALPAALTGTYIRTFNPNAFVKSIDGALNALKEQGQVKVVSQPRIRTLNNQSAIVRVGTERTFFITTTDISTDSSGSVIRTTTNAPSTITEGLVLTVTPQISELGEITMDVNPVLTHIAGTDVSPDGLSNAPILDVKQTSTLVRMSNGETIVVGGLIQDTRSNTKRAVPVFGEVPVVGALFSGTYDRDVRKELVVFLTPHIIE